jgi:hypothetical protein
LVVIPEGDLLLLLAFWLSPQRDLLLQLPLWFAIFLLPFFAQKSDVKPQNHLTH